MFLLKTLDRKWIEHIDDMDVLRQGVGLRAYGNRNPVVVYQTEGFDMFDDMISAMRRDVANIMMSVMIRKATPQSQRPQRPTNMSTNGKAEGPVQKKKETGRNDPCPCGSGKKFKNCCGQK